eukprot:6044185-Pleurochrysis_carterae.AAC.1
MSEKSALNDCFSFFAFALVISSREKSNTCARTHARTHARTLARRNLACLSERSGALGNVGRHAPRQSAKNSARPGLTVDG